MSIEPRNLTAQLHHRAAGNPPSTLPESAISNCFPGLEFDFRNLWRRIFQGIEIHESSGVVVAVEPGQAVVQTGFFLIAVAGEPTFLGLRGPTATAEDAELPGITWLEWSNSLAEVLASSAGQPVPCEFFDPEAQTTVTVELQIRPVFEASEQTGEVIPLVAEELATPGELTQSLCSPWQNDYRECGCYYWAASRPDYVNVEPTARGASIGNNWMARSRDPKVYEPDTASNPRQLSYEDLFRNWQGLLRFIVEGRDHD
jgi:hypothetical protein